MKLAALVTIGAITIGIWTSVFYLLGQDPSLLISQFERSMLNEINERDSFIQVFSDGDQSIQLDEIASVNKNQEILYAFEQSNPVSIEEILAALGIE